MSPKLVSVLPLLILRYELKVNPDSAFNVLAVPEPVIILSVSYTNMTLPTKA